MEAVWVEGTVGEHGEVFLKDLALPPGRCVEMLILEPPAKTGSRKDLRNSVLEYREPMEPAAAEDWEALGTEIPQR